MPVLRAHKSEPPRAIPHAAVRFEATPSHCSTLLAGASVPLARPAQSLEEDTASGESGPLLLPSESVAATPLSGLVTKYYYFGSERVAMNKWGTLSFFATDHLGSTNIVADPNVGLTTRQTYYAFGAPRTAESGLLSTDHIPPEEEAV